MSIEQKLDEISGSIRAIHNTQSQHTSVLAKLEERSEQHEKRMDRKDYEKTLERLQLELVKLLAFLEAIGSEQESRPDCRETSRISIQVCHAKDQT